MNITIINYITVHPITINALIMLIVIVCLLVISAFVSASEVAFFSLTPSDRERIDNNEHRNDLWVERLLDDPEYLLSTILITNNLVNVAIIVLSSFLLNTIFDFEGHHILAFLFESVIITFIILLFSEIMPKIFAQQHQLKMARFASVPLKGMKWLLFPANYVLVNSTSVVNKILSKHKHNNLTLNDLSQALELTQDTIKEDADILQGIVNFGNINAAGIMTPRMDMITIDVKDSFEKVIQLIIEHEYSRIPVLQGTSDNVRGILYAKDLIPYINKTSNFKWQTLIRQPYFVPETIRIDDLLQEFQKNRIHIAIVVDEYGGTSGLVTMEDILEEVIGEICDEHDGEEEKLYKVVGNNCYIFEAKILLTDFFKAIEAEPDDFDQYIEEADTLAGLLLEINGDFPQQGEEIHFSKYTFIVTKMDERRIEKVKVTVN